MLTKDQKDSIMRLYGKGLNISEIARNIGVSRHSVYRTIQSDFEEDAEIHALEKKLKKAKLERSIREVRRPFDTESKINKLEKAVDSIFGRFLFCRGLCSDVPDGPQHCAYCGEELEYQKIKTGEYSVPKYRCHKCKKLF